jgi:hypothetical protein
MAILKTIAVVPEKTLASSSNNPSEQGATSSKKWLWIGLGVLAAGAVAASASGSSSGSTSATTVPITIKPSEPN